MSNFQRRSAKGNANIGRDFETRAQDIPAAQSIPLEMNNHKAPCGLAGNEKKMQAFDLDSKEPPVIVECQSQTWTKSDSVPSAKMKDWNEAMCYCHMAPPMYRKIFFFKQSLLACFRRTQGQMIPPDVAFWELPRDSNDVKIFRSIADGH